MKKNLLGFCEFQGRGYQIPRPFSAAGSNSWYEKKIYLKKYHEAEIWFFFTQNFYSSRTQYFVPSLLFIEII